MEHKGHARRCKALPERVKIDVTRRAVADRMIWHPDRSTPCLKRKVDLEKGKLRIIERNHADAHYSLVAGAKVAHRPVMGARRSVANVVTKRAARGEERRFAMSGKYRLPAKAEYPERN